MTFNSTVFVANHSPNSSWITSASAKEFGGPEMPEKQLQISSHQLSTQEVLHNERRKMHISYSWTGVTLTGH